MKLSLYPLICCLMLLLSTQAYTTPISSYENSPQQETHVSKKDIRKSKKEQRKEIRKLFKENRTNLPFGLLLFFIIFSSIGLVFFLFLTLVAAGFFAPAGVVVFFILMTLLSVFGIIMSTLALRRSNLPIDDGSPGVIDVPFK